MFFDAGTIKLGTLFEFRNEELHGVSIGDCDEGRETRVFTHSEIQEFELLSDDPRAVFARQVLKGWDEFPTGTKLKIRMMPSSRLELYGSSPNYLMHCSSLKFDRRGMIRMGYDSCVSIKSPYMFYLEISKALEDLFKFEIGAPVIYSNRIIPYNTEPESHPAFVKPVSYHYQSEFRVVWSSKSAQEISPRIINCPEARQYCDVYCC